MLDRDSTGRRESPSFLQSLKLLVAGLSSAFHTRLELFVTELEEERERLKQSIILLLLAFFGLSLGLTIGTIFVVALFWERGWIAAIGILALIYLAVGVGAALALRQKVLTRPGLFTATLAELGKDSDRLKRSAHE